MMNNKKYNFDEMQFTKLLKLLIHFSFVLTVINYSSDALSEPRVLNTGLLFTPDSTAKSFKKVQKTRGTLPPRIDLASRMPPPGDQGNQSSCVGWAVAYGARSYYQGLDTSELHNNKNLFSPAYIYNQIRGNKNSCQEGSYIHQALDLMKNQGVATLAEFSYQQNNCSSIPSPDIKSIAKKNAIKDWSYFGSGNISFIKSELYKGNPVIVAMNVDDTFLNLVGDTVYNNKSRGSRSGHAMVIIGYDDSRQAFRLLNSWGADWGNRGYGWVDYETMRLHGQEYFVMEIAAPPTPPAPEPGPSPKPNPKPSPAPTPNNNVVPVVPDDPPEPNNHTVNLKELTNKLKVLTTGMECGRVEATVDSWGIVRLEGFIGKQDNLSKLMRKIRSMSGISHVESSVRITPWPLCEAYLALQSLPKESKELNANILDHPDNIMNVGDMFAIEVKMPKKPGYAYATYLQSSGDAVSFFWGKSYTPSQVLNLGGAGYKITAPIGNEMLIIITSPKPLFKEESTNLTKPDKSYLSQLKKTIQALPDKEREKITFAALEITTRKP